MSKGTLYELCPKKGLRVSEKDKAKNILTYMYNKMLILV